MSSQDGACAGAEAGRAGGTAMEGTVTKAAPWDGGPLGRTLGRTLERTAVSRVRREVGRGAERACGVARQASQAVAVVRSTRAQAACSRGLVIQWR